MEITEPADLARAIRQAQEAMAAGLLVEERAGDGGMMALQPFDEVSAEGPWDDVISHDFRCTTCSERFSLTAETYHGRGGHWQRMGK